MTVDEARRQDPAGDVENLHREAGDLHRPGRLDGLDPSPGQYDVLHPQVFGCVYLPSAQYPDHAALLDRGAKRMGSYLNQSPFLCNPSR